MANTTGTLTQAQLDAVNNGLGSIGTEGDLFYRDATGLQKLAKGTSGQTLKMGGSNAPEWVTVDAPASTWTVISTAVASSSSSIDFTSGLTSTYQQYAIVVSSAVFNGGGVQMLFTVSDDGGSSYESSNYSFHLSKSTSSGGESHTAFNSIGSIRMHEDLTNSAGTNWTSVVYLNDPANASLFTQVRWDGVSARSTSEYTRWDAGAGAWNVTTAVNAIRFAPSGGTITSGRFTLYGLSHA